MGQDSCGFKMAPADIVLDNATNNFAGTVNASGANVSLTDANELTLGTLTTTGNLILNNAGALNLGTNTVGSSLNVNTGGESISQDDALAVNGSSTLNAGNSAGVIVDFKGSVGTTASNIVAISVPKGTAVSGVGFSFELPESIKTAAQQVAQPPKVLQADGSPLPSWLKFDPQRLRFDSEAVPDSAVPMQIVMVVGQERVIVVISERSQ